MTIVATEHPMRRLAGQTLVALEPLEVYVADPAWEPVLGRVLLVPGGTALDIDDGFLAAEATMAEKVAADMETPEGEAWHLPAVPCVIRDPDLPAVRVLVNPDDADARCNVVARGAGPRAGRDPTRCGHPARTVDDLIGRTCSGCFLRWWQLRKTAAEAQQ